jgi:NAD(P)-dependent dehydrogenase (short-subunit alcohol dehydrogenase family)
MTANNSAPRVALVTGGADGIGLATGIVLARDGYRVAIADLQIDLARQRATDLGSGHLALRCDVSSETDVAAAMVEIEKTYGRLDAVVNNAGVGAPHLPTFEQTVEAFERVLHIHLTGTFLVSREALKLMTAARADGAGGAVVNVSSIAGLVGMPRRNAYGAAKAGIASMTRICALRRARQRGGARICRDCAGAQAGARWLRRHEAARLTGADGPTWTAGGDRRGDRLPVLAASELHQRHRSRRGWRMGGFRRRRTGRRRSRGRQLSEARREDGWGAPERRPIRIVN